MTRHYNKVITDSKLNDGDDNGWPFHVFGLVIKHAINEYQGYGKKIKAGIKLNSTQECCYEQVKTYLFSPNGLEHELDALGLFDIVRISSIRREAKGQKVFRQTELTMAGGE